MPLRGTSAFISTRHDEHHVDALAMSAGTPVGRFVAIEPHRPQPDQPRQVMGDLSELIASIAEKGVIEPLAAASAASDTEIAGERR